MSNENAGCRNIFLLMLIIMLLTVILTGCGGGSSSSGAKASQPTTGEPAVVSMLAQIDRDFVRSLILGWEISEGRTDVSTVSGIVYLGEDFWTWPVPWQIGTVVHETDHVLHRDPTACVPCEVRANHRAAEALKRIGEFDTADMWMNLDGGHL